jgi:hypothetical protein
MKTWILGLGCLGVAALAHAGCDGDETTPIGGGTCIPTDPSCPAVGVSSDCLALVDNSGKDQFTLRLSQLSITAPVALTTALVSGIVADGVYINLPTCNVSGMGSFSLMTEVDLATNTLRVGGAYPEEDPSNGYCFVYDAQNGVEPVEVAIEQLPGGGFRSEAFPRAVVPVFTDRSATTVVYLPLRDTTLSRADLSADHNCIGRFNTEGIVPETGCEASPPEVEYFVNGGELEGYIQIEEADEVIVDLAGQSLCVLLSNDPNQYGDGGDPNRCKRDGGGAIELKGDWCSTTNSAGGCQDSFRMQAEFAASAASLRTDCPADPTGAGGGGAGGGSGGTGGAGGN